MVLSATKYFALGDGVALLFSSFIMDGPIALGVRLSGTDAVHLTLNESYFALVTDDLQRSLEAAEALYIAVSAADDYQISFVGSLLIDRLLIGKMQAYKEVASRGVSSS